MDKDVNYFKVILNDCLSQFLPSPWDGNGDLYSKQHYETFIAHCRNKNLKFEEVEGGNKG